MAHELLKQQVWEANRLIAAWGLAPLTWGNASGADRAAGVMAIKPSGADYEQLRPEDIVVLSLVAGEVVEGALKPPSDTPTHLVLYRAFEGIGGIVHTHSTHATAWAQACREIPCLGTTHADHFYGSVPLTRQLTEREISEAYEEHTGRVIVERFHSGAADPVAVPGVLVAGHGPFTWGKNTQDAARNAFALEQVARMTLHTMALNPLAPSLPQVLLDKHYLRKHGDTAYYGQVDSLPQKSANDIHHRDTENTDEER